MLEFMRLFFSDVGVFMGVMAIGLPVAIIVFCLFLALKD